MDYEKWMELHMEKKFEKLVEIVKGIEWQTDSFENLFESMLRVQNLSWDLTDYCRLRKYGRLPAPKSL